MSSFYNNVIRVTTNNATAMNAEIATQNAADFLLTNIVFDASTRALLLFVSNAGASYVPTAPQKVNLLPGSTQTDVDTDTAAEAPAGYVPTGLFFDPATDNLYIAYQLLNDSSL